MNAETETRGTLVLAEDIIETVRPTREVPPNSFPVMPESTDPVKPLGYYEFFAGAGLVRLALEPTWKCLWANDIDPMKAEVYAANFGGAELQVGDVSQVAAATLPAGAHMAWASFPCQDLSLAGWRRGMSAERSGSFWAFWRLMRDLHQEGRRPPLVVIENVVGLLHGADFAGFCEALAAIDLQFGALVVDARRFVPQSRPRVFVVGVDARANCSTFTTTLPKGSPWFPGACFRAWNTLSGPARGLWRWWRLPSPTDPLPSAESLIEEHPEGVRWHTKEETDRLLSLMSTANLEKVCGAGDSGRREVGFLYRRTRGTEQRAEVRFDGVAGCLRTPRGGSSRQTVLIVQGLQIRSRLLSPREAARLMGAPDSFILPSSYNDAYKAMGDGVAVPAVRWLADHLLTPLVQGPVADLREHDPAGGRLTLQSVRSRAVAEELAARWEARAAG